MLQRRESFFATGFTAIPEVKFGLGGFFGPDCDDILLNSAGGRVYAATQGAVRGAAGFTETSL
jgi:hypothetical protein